MRVQLYAAMATLKIGLDLLLEGEQVRIDQLLGHGGLFKTPEVGQRLLAGALDIPVSVMETAGEGGPWGMAILAAYMADKTSGESLEGYLKNRVFAAEKKTTIQPQKEDVAGFAAYLKNYKAALTVEKAAADALQ